MADAASPAPNQAEATAGEGRVLLVIIASSPAMLDELITALLDIGMSGGTVIESKGIGAILREEMPIFAGLAAMLPETTGSRMVFSVTTRAVAEQIFNWVEKELKPARRPIVVTVPVERAVGLTR
ncbi:MAG: hypothetical protein VYC34_06790 [Planctomycetota bacterium]|nr:hypothetical protein [Planctomycetota bacterium]